MAEPFEVYLAKATESLESAQADLAADRYNSSANRSYYACFQAAVAALLRAGIRVHTPDGELRHGTVQALFVGQLINRRHHYPSEFRTTLTDNRDLRDLADYTRTEISQLQARRAVRRAERLISAIRGMI